MAFDPTSLPAVVTFGGMTTQARSYFLPVTSPIDDVNQTENFIRTEIASFFLPANVSDDLDLSSATTASRLDDIETRRADLRASAECEVLMKFIINSLFAGVLCTVGFAGNIASYVVLGRDTDILPVARFLLRSLAVADNAFIAVWFVNFSLWDLLSYIAKFGGQHGGARMVNLSSAGWMYFRMTTYPLMFVGQTATIWLTVLIAASRCLAVCWPSRAAAYCSLTATRLGVAGVAVFSVIYNVPRYFETELVWNASRIVNFTRTEFGSSKLYQVVYFDILYYIICFALPLLLLTLFNARLIVAYRAFQQKRLALRAINPGRRNCGRRLLNGESNEQNVTLIMIVVILVFMICNVPAKVVQIGWNYRIQRCPTPEFFARELSVVFELISSSVNFLIYCVFLRRFRQRFLIASWCGSRDGGGVGGRGADVGRPLNGRRTTLDGSLDAGILLQDRSAVSATPSAVYRRTMDF